MSSAFSISDTHGANALRRFTSGTACHVRRSPEGFGVRASSRPARHALSPLVPGKWVTRARSAVLAFRAYYSNIATTDETEMRKVLVSHRHFICLGYSIEQGKRSLSHHRSGGVLHASFSGGRSSVPGTGSEKRPGELSLRR